jgi:hypothetical protein
MKSKLSVLFLLSLFACSSSIKRTTQSTLTPSSIGSEPQILGGNFNSKGRFFDPGVRCIEVDEQRDVEVVHNEKANVAVTSNIDYDTLSREVSGGFSAGASMPAGDPISAGLNFLKNSGKSDTSIGFNYRTSVITGDVLLKAPYKLTREAADAGAKSEEKFIEYCGDQFVYKINKGASAYVSVKIDVGSVETKRAIEGELGITAIDFFELTANLKNLVKKFGLSGKVTISAYQEGGFAARINSIFGSGEGMAQCNSASFAKCEILLKEIVNYFGHEFAQQFDHYYRDIFAGGVTALPPSSKTISYSTQSYCKLPENERPSTLDCGSVDNSDSLDLIEKDKNIFLNEITAISELSNSSTRLAPDYKKLLELYQTQMISNLGQIQAAQKECSRDRWACKTTVEEVQKMYFPRNPQLIASLKKEERIEICFNSGSPVELSRMNVKLMDGENQLKMIKIFDSPKYENRECFLYHAPELSGAKITGLSIQVAHASEVNEAKCKLRVDKKFSSWVEWNLKSVEITQLATGKKTLFKGSYFKKGKKCVEESEAQAFLPWKELDLDN